LCQSLSCSIAPIQIHRTEMILHWRFDILDPFYLLFHDSHSFSWRASFKVWSIDRDGRHETCTSVALEIFGRGGSSHLWARTCWIFYDDRVEPYPFDHRFWCSTCWRKWKKFASAVYHSRIPMLKIYSMRYWFFISRLYWTFSDGYFFPSPFSILDKKCGYVNEKMQTPVRFVSVTCPLYRRTMATPISTWRRADGNRALAKTSNISYIIFKRYNKINRKFVRKFPFYFNNRLAMRSFRTSIVIVHK